VGSQAKFFIRKEPGLEDVCPLWVGWSWGGEKWIANGSWQGGRAAAGWWAVAAKLGRGLLGLGITGGQDGKLGLRETASWFPESTWVVVKHWQTLGGLRLTEGTCSHAK